MKECCWLIKAKDVVRLRIPYPDINSTLAQQAHMYICYNKGNDTKEFVKCQTFKNKMLINNTVRNFIKENPDPNRNPFKRTTLIDCDKLFLVDGVRIDLSLRTCPISCICESLYRDVSTRVMIDGCCIEKLDIAQLLCVNPMISKIT